MTAKASSAIAATITRRYRLPVGAATWIRSLHSGAQDDILPEEFPAAERGFVSGHVGTETHGRSDPLGHGDRYREVRLPAELHEVHRCVPPGAQCPEHRGATTRNSLDLERAVHARLPRPSG